MSIRSVARILPNYSDINREERHYAAVLFAALCQPGNVERFLRLCEIHDRPGADLGVYFEYAYLRDLWNGIRNDDIKKEIIRQHLPIAGIDAILRQSMKEINQTFGVAGEGSPHYLDYPGKWAITKFSATFPDNDDFLRICRFKWSFNIKPDIVIHLRKDRAVCVEAKYESGEGFYPSSQKDRRIFHRRRLPLVGQMDLQKYMMQDLLGVVTGFVLLAVGTGVSKTHKPITWAEAFEHLDMSGMPSFTIRMAKSISV